jgi:hypothetical protein
MYRQSRPGCRPRPMTGILPGVHTAHTPWISRAGIAPGQSVRPAMPHQRTDVNGRICVGGIYGIGGGSILAPVMIAPGRPLSEVAPAALASTFVTSAAG